MGETEQYKVVKEITLQNIVPKGAKMATSSKTFEVGDIIKGEVTNHPENDQEGFMSTGRYFFPMEKGKSEYLKKISKTRQAIYPDLSDDSKSLDETMDNLKNTQLIHYGIMGGAVAVGATIGCGIAYVMKKSPLQKGLFSVSGMLLLGIPAIIWISPITKEVNTKLKNLKEM